MNKHSKRSVEHIINSIIQYFEGKINKDGLLRNTAGNCEAIEEREVQKEIERIIDKIEDALWTYDEDEGVLIIKNNLKKLEQLIKV